jgi:hypothetical protein
MIQISQLNYIKKIQVKQNMLVKLCASNYLTHDGLVNGVDGIFQTSSKLLNSQQVIWISFNNPKSDQLIKNLKCTWTPINFIFRDIKIGLNSIHIKTNIQFHVQLIITCTINQTQGLTFDHLTFDPNGIYKHVLKLITRPHIKK